MDELYKKKYLKYKNKYVNLQNQLGGNKQLIIKNAEDILDSVLLIDNTTYKISNEIIEILTNMIKILNLDKNVDDKIFINLKNKTTELLNNYKSNIITQTDLLKSNYKKLNRNLIKSENISFQFIGQGSFGCVFSPPTLILPPINQIKQDYPNSQIKINDYNDNKYVAKILSYTAYLEEYKINKILIKYDNNGDYTPKIIFAGFLHKLYLINLINQQRRYSHLNQLYKCLNDKVYYNSEQYYGYIISTKVGKSLDQLTNNDINKTNIKEVLTSYSTAIKNFINKLYENKYVHGDIKTPNMTIKDNKIYFIDFGLTEKYNINDNYKPKILSYSAPILLILFSVFYNKYGPSYKANINIYISLLDNIIINDINFLSVKNTLLHPFIFKNISDIQEYLKKHIRILLKSLNLTIQYTTQQIYKLCFSSIAINTDIYSLSLVMFNLFIKNTHQPDFTLRKIVNNETIKLIVILFKDALHNTIKDPLDLSSRLDAIIETI